MQIQLPYAPSALLHKHGGKITSIERVSHDTAKPVDGRSQDIWFFIGDIEWSDGSKSKGREIPPWVVCIDGDEGQQEINALMKVMNDYLAENGKWCERDSEHEGWYANQR